MLSGCIVFLFRLKFWGCLRNGVFVYFLSSGEVLSLVFNEVIKIFWVVFKIRLFFFYKWV